MPEQLTVAEGPWFQAQHFTEALAIYDGVKDAVISPAAPSHAASVEIVKTFGLPPNVDRIAKAISSDEAAMIREHGGKQSDVEITLLVDGMLLGLALAVQDPEMTERIRRTLTSALGREIG